MNAATTRISNVFGHPCEVIRARFGTMRFDRHFHDTFSIGIVTSGANVFSYRRKQVEVLAGSTCIADPGEVHDGGLAGRPWSYANIFIPAGLFEALSREDGTDTEPVFALGKVTDRTSCAAVAAFFCALFAPEATEETMDELAVSAFGRLLRCHAVDRPPTSRTDGRPMAKRAVEIMNDRHGKGVPLSLLARETGLSRYGVIRAVSSAVGLTPVAYMIQLRVVRAKALIHAGMPLAEAALEAGFADQPHMTRAMKRHWGITPGGVKKGRTETAQVTSIR